MFRLLLVIIGLWAVMNCADRSEFKKNIDLPDTLFTKSDDFTDIDVFSVDQPLKIPTISEDINFIPLETTENSLFKYVDDLYVNDSLIIINTRSSVLFWDENGKFIRRFSKLGRGPEEYETIFGFAVDFVNNQMAIADQKSIKLYSLKGDFIKDLKIPKAPFSLTSNLMFLDPGHLLVESQRFKPDFKEGYSPLWIVDLTTEEFQPFFNAYPEKVYEFYHKYTFYGAMASTNDGVIYAAREAYNIYRVKEESEPKLAFKMDFGEYQMPEGLIHDTRRYHDFKKLFVQLADINESEDYLFVRYGINRGINGRDFRMGFYVFDKKKRELLANQFESKGMISDKYSDMFFWPKYVTGKNQLVCIIENQEAVKNKIKGAKKGDNPTIVIVSLK